MKSVFGKMLVILGAVFISNVAYGTIAGEKDTSGKMNVNISSATRKSNYTMRVDKSNEADDVFVTIYDNNNTKVFSEKLGKEKLLKKKYKLSRHKSNSYYFVIESGNEIHTQEIM